jgi:hypothetical protein
MQNINVTEPVIQAAAIAAAVEIAKSLYKSEAVRPDKVALLAKDLIGHLASGDARLNG